MYEYTTYAMAFISIYRRHHLLNNILLIVYGSCSSAPGNILYRRPVKKQPWLYQMCKCTWYTARYMYTAEKGHINTGEICNTVPTHIGYAISAIKAKNILLVLGWQILTCFIIAKFGTRKLDWICLARIAYQPLFKQYMLLYLMFLYVSRVIHFLMNLWNVKFHLSGYV